MNVIIPILTFLLHLTFNINKQSIPILSTQTGQPHKKNKQSKLEFTSGILSILNDSKGNYWFGSHNEGVCLFDGKSFEYFTTYDGLSNNQIHSIQEDNNGIIWFETANGISSYNGIKITNHNPILLYNNLTNWQKTENDLWFGAGNTTGVYRYNSKNINYLELPISKIINPNNPFHVTGISYGKNNLIWIATYAGVFGYDGNQFTIINDETTILNNTKGSLHIRSILEDTKGRLWIGNNGIGVLLQSSDSLINFSEENNLIHSSSTRRGDKSKAGTLEHVFAIEEDEDGNIWFGDRDTGAWKYDGSKMYNFTKKDGLTHNFIQTIYNDKNGELWFGLTDGNVFKFNGETFVKQF